MSSQDGPGSPRPRGWWRLPKGPRRALQTFGWLMVAVLVTLNQYLDPEEGTWLRWVWAATGGLLFFVNAPSLFGRSKKDGTTRADSRAGTGAEVRPVSSPAEPGDRQVGDRPPADPRFRLGFRSTVRQRWPWLARWLPGFRLRRPADLPQRQPTRFRGRVRELAELEAALEALHEEVRAAPRADSRSARRSLVSRGLRGEGETTSPTPMVRIFGMPGVGKTALAQELGHRVRRRYGDGQLYANLGSASVARQPAEVLKEFLLALGWPEDEIPVDTQTRGKIFRSLTYDQSILVVLDAARDADQLRELLPVGRRCAVVVTSRADLGNTFGGRSLLLGLPDDVEAKEILRAASRDDAGPEPVYAAAIAWGCGHLPRALRAAGARTIREDVELEEVSRQVWGPEPLKYLTIDGDNPRKDFETEYNRLLPQEKRAFRLLTLVASPTFVSWVLQPLLDIEALEAEGLLRAMRKLHLVEVVDSGPGLPKRYRFHPLVGKLSEVLRAETAAEDPAFADDVARARVRLDQAYLEVSRQVLSRAAEPVSTRAGEAARWMPDEWVFANIRTNRERWVREEQANLVHCLLSEHSTDPELAWRIARWLGGYVPLGTKAEAVGAALDACVTAKTSAHGRLWIGLARTAHLAAIDDHDAALDEARWVIDAASTAGLDRVAAIGKRLCAEINLDMGAYAAAAECSEAARSAVADLGPQPNGTDGRPSVFHGAGEPELVTLLRTASHAAVHPASWLGEEQAGLPDHADNGAAAVPDRLGAGGIPDWHDTGTFRDALVKAEGSRRRGAWDDALRQLDDAATRHRADACRLARIQLAQAYVHLTRAQRAETDERGRAYAGMAVERAGQAVLTARDMGNRIGELKARVLLTRALVRAGRPDEAERQKSKVERRLRDLDRGDRPGWSLVVAQADIARAELRIATARAGATAGATAGSVPRQRAAGAPDPSQGQDTVALLVPARATFERYGDWRSAAECDLLLGAAAPLANDPYAAVEALARAAGRFRAARDTDQVRYADARLLEVLTANQPGSENGRPSA